MNSYLAAEDDELQVNFQPFKARVIENIRVSTRQERLQWLKDSGYNLYNLRSSQIMIDLLTDSGTGALSQAQMSNLVTGDESYAGAESYYRFERAVNDLTGFKHVYPVHQGRAAERILFTVLGGEDKTIANNSFFITTRLNAMLTKTKAVDLICDEAKDLYLDAPFKGNMDIERLETLLEECGDKVPLVMLTLPNNIDGGHPVSMQNVRQVKEVCKRFHKPLFFDGCRFAENCYLIKTREQDFADKSVKEICQELFSYADGMTMSAKKDGLAHIGGWIALNDDALAEKLEQHIFITEGFKTYGGLAGRDLDMIATGLAEVVEFNYLKHRFYLNEDLARKLNNLGVPVLKPVIGHAIFVDAGAFLPGICAAKFPAQALSIALYVEGGIRSCEIGSLSYGGQAPCELVRLAMPRRVYTEDQLNHVVEAFKKIIPKKDKLCGFRIVRAPTVLRQFTAVIEFVD